MASGCEKERLRLSKTHLDSGGVSLSQLLLNAARGWRVGIDKKRWGGWGNQSTATNTIRGRWAGIDKKDGKWGSLI
jgi:hypothetical protein